MLGWVDEWGTWTPANPDALTPKLAWITDRQFAIFYIAQAELGPGLWVEKGAVVENTTTGRTTVEMHGSASLLRTYSANNVGGILSVERALGGGFMVTVYEGGSST